MNNLIRIIREGGFGLVLFTFAMIAAPQNAGAFIITNCGDGNSSFGTACSLGELNEGGNFIINDKQFLNWNLGLIGGQALNSEAIRVDLIDNLGRPGFTLFDTAAAFRVENGVSSLTELSFDVNITGGPFSIVVNELNVAFGAISGNASASVFEDAADRGGSVLTSLSAVCNNPSCANSIIGIESSSFAPQTLLQIVKDIDLLSGAGGVAEINTITQLFTQQANIPEPGIFALLLVGIAIGLQRLGYRSTRMS